MIKYVTGKGFTKEEAFSKTSLRGEVVKVANLSFDKALQPVGEEFEEWSADYAKKYLKDGQFACVIITSPVKDTRKRPYSVDHVTREEGYTKQWETVFEIFSTNEEGEIVILDDSSTKQAEAYEKAKELVTDLRVDLSIRVAKREKNGKAHVGDVKYTPSKGTQEGAFRFFGTETV